MIGQQISLGIGSPASIEYFVLVGLSATGPVSVEDADGEIVYVLASDRTVSVSASDRTVSIDAVDRTVIAPTRPTP